jgi:DNA primase
MNRPNRAPEIKHALTDVTRVLDGLGMLGQGKQRQKQAGGWIILCPWHAENTPSCSVRLVDGVILAKCHGCDAGGDVLSLVAVARGLSTGRDFRQVLVEAARLGGLWQIVDELEGRGEAPAPRPIARTTPAQEAPVRDYPPSGEVEALWARSGPADEDPAVSEYLWSRGLNPVLVDTVDLGRAVPADGAMPRWARCRFGDWREAGYRIVVPMYDANGDLRSVRGWRVTDGEGPKRLPPFGHKASELVMADAWALAWLRGERQPERVVVVEGEPDWMTWSTHLNDPHTATIGIVSGSWHEALARKFPVGCRVDVRTDHDDAGDRYASEVEKSLRRRCFVHRTRRVAA